MKKVLICMAAAATVLSGVTAMASDGYSPTENSVTVTDAAGSKAVLIAKNTGSSMTAEDIVYVGQDVSATEFFLKESPAPGVYTIVLGNASGETRRANFVIGDASEVFTSVAELEVLDGTTVDDGETMTKAYVSKATIPLSDIKTIVVECDGKSVYNSINASTELSGEGGATMVGVKLSGIPKTSSAVSVYISSVPVSTDGLITD